MYLTFYKVVDVKSIHLLFVSILSFQTMLVLHVTEYAVVLVLQFYNRNA